MPPIQTATVKQLAYKIKGVGPTPSARFAVFLGAGASVQSGIPAAAGMIRDFKRRIIEAECPDTCKTDAEKENWLKAQPWFDPIKAYCSLFEHFEPKEIGRQRYIEALIEGHKPSFGYVMLANLMATGYINTIITTNFDDLVYSACTTFTDIRPIVYAYGVLASEMRVTAKRPKILKLHGDYLYSVLKITGAEIETQDPNMSRQVSAVLNEYGLVVIGYGGNDESVMRILSQISAKNDLYWCVHRSDEPGQMVKDLLAAKRGFLVRIGGFDEMMNEIRGVVGFDVNAMLGSIQKRQEEMIDQLKRFAPEARLAHVLSEIATALEAQTAQQHTQAQKHRALAYFAQGVEAQVSANADEAEKVYSKALELDPTDAATYYNLGTVLDDNLARAGEAEAAYRKAIELNPKDAAAYYNLGLLLAKDATRAADAEAAYRKAIELDPEHSKAYNNLGNVLAKDPSRVGEAEAAYGRAIELDPKDGSAYYNLGNLLAETESRTEEAEAAYRKAIELDPKDVMACYNLGNLLSKDGSRAGDAEAAYRKAIELDPKDAAAYGNLGILLAKDASRVEEAEAAYRKAIEIDPKGAQAYYNLGNLLAASASRVGEAEAAYHRVIELEPADSHGYSGLSLLLRQQGRESEALPLLEKMLGLEPHSFDALLALASVNKKLDHLEQSAVFAAQARVVVKPDGWYNLACLESICGNVDKAIEYLRCAAQAGRLNRIWARNDPDLEWIRDDPRFKEIVGENGGAEPTEAIAPDKQEGGESPSPFSSFLTS